MSAFAPDGRLSLDWMRFLGGIDYPYSQLAQVGQGEAGLREALPELKALIYWGIFSGEVSNGGVAQFFFNQVPHLPDFEATAKIIAAHPLLEEAAAFAEETLAAFPGYADAVAQARRTGGWPEELFESLKPQFENLETRIWEAGRRIDARLDIEVLTNTERYVDFSCTEGWQPDLTGALEISQAGGASSRKWRLQFVDGFPFGPNTLVHTRAEGTFRSEIRISPDHLHIETDAGPYRDGNTTRRWKDHRIQRTERRVFSSEGRLLNVERENFQWKRTGEQVTVFEEGGVERLELYDDGVQLKSVCFYPDGRVFVSTAMTEEGQRTLRYWPSGQLNVEFIAGAGAVRYLNGYLADGRQTLKDGEGDLTFFRSIQDGITQTFTCPVEEGRLHGTQIEWRDGEETSRKDYARGEVVGPQVED